MGPFRILKVWSCYSRSCVKTETNWLSLRESLGDRSNPARVSEGMIRRRAPAIEHTDLSLRRRLADCGNPRRTLLVLTRDEELRNEMGCRFV